jgi:hypothetical protein
MLTELAESLTAAGIKGSPRKLLADAGYFSADNVAALTDAGIDSIVTGPSPPSWNIGLAPRVAPGRVWRPEWPYRARVSRRRSRNRFGSQRLASVGALGVRERSRSELDSPEHKGER